MGFLEQAGYAPASLDIAVEKIDPERIKQARFVGISVPMHTALRLGVRVAELVREMNPSCHICFYGLYASLNAEYLLQLFTPAHPRRDDPLQPGATGTPTRPFPFADSVIGGEYEAPLVRVMEALERGDALTNVEGVSHRGKIGGPHLKRLALSVPSRNGRTPLQRYAHFERGGAAHVVGCGLLQRLGAHETGAGAHTRGCVRRARDRPPGRDHAARVVGAVHPVGDARRLSRAVRHRRIPRSG